jgi:GTP-binding protein
VIIKDAQFIVSNTDVNKCPKTDKPEYAFIGRSNVGKSSLINMLTDHRKLAKISGRPGKTQLINHFLINKEWFLVDLPGYGYAKSSKTDRRLWEKFIRKYLLLRDNLYCVFVLIDSRLSAQNSDVEFMQWLGVSEVPFVIVFTKTDKLNKTEFANFQQQFEEELYKTWDELPQMFVSSAETGLGKDEILQFIDTTNNI